jgi:hypothetical protein
MLMASIKKTITTLGCLISVIASAHCSKAFGVGEIQNHKNQLIAEQFAPPVNGGQSNLLLFSKTAKSAELWIVFPLRPELSKSVPLIGFTSELEQREATIDSRSSLVNDAGIWLVGSVVNLIRSKGEIISVSLKGLRNSYQAVGLTDKSVLVAGCSLSQPPIEDCKTIVVERVWEDSTGKLQTELLPPLAIDQISNTGKTQQFKTVVLKDERILFTGGRLNKFTYTFDVGAKSWRAHGSQKRERYDPAIIRKADGKVWVTGGRGPDWQSAVTSEIWDPKTGLWIDGPELPVPTRGHSAIYDVNQNDIILAAGTNPYVLIWRQETNTVEIAAVHSGQRLGAGLLSLPGNRLALVSGSQAPTVTNPTNIAEGVSILELSKSPVSTFSSAFEFDFVHLQNGELLATNRKNSRSLTPFDSIKRIDSIDIFNPSKEQHRIELSLPSILSNTQLSSINSTSALIAGNLENSEQLWLGKLDLRAGSINVIEHSLKINQASLAHYGKVSTKAKLVGSDNRQAWLVSESSDVFLIDLNTLSGRLGPQLLRQRFDFVGRVLTDGRIVIAGGNVEADLIAAYTEGCQACPEKYIGIGAPSPSRRHEIFDPALGVWISSAPSRGAGGAAAILSNGIVVKAGLISEKIKAVDSKENPNLPTFRNFTRLEVSDINGRNWREVNWPVEVSPINEKELQLLSVVSNVPTLNNAVFALLPTGKSNNEQWRWFWTLDVTSPTITWLPLGGTLPNRAQTFGATASGLKDQRGAPIFFIAGTNGVVAFTR